MQDASAYILDLNIASDYSNFVALKIVSIKLWLDKITRRILPNNQLVYAAVKIGDIPILTVLPYTYKYIYHKFNILQKHWRHYLTKTYPYIRKYTYITQVHAIKIHKSITQNCRLTQNCWYHGYFNVTDPHY